MQDSPVPEIHWFTTQYVVPEDRLRLSCTLKTGDTDVFWLTQRLANALITKLLELLDQQTVQDRRFADLDHRFAQKSAVAKMPKKAPGQIPQGAGWLAQAVGVHATKRAVVLTFKDGAERALCLKVDTQHLRQWLIVVSRQYRRSGWPMDLWPDWIAEDSPTQPETTPTLLN